MATIDTQTRKVGDTLRLSGVLTGDTIPTTAPDWAGAVAVINIVLDSDASAYRTSGAVTLTTSDPTAVRYQYEGSPPVLADIGTYRYEIEVTFSDLTVTSFPNSADKYKLKIVAELG